MKILIDIPEKYYKQIKDNFFGQTVGLLNIMITSIVNGTPISKELGNYLIRRDFMEKLGATCIAKRSESGELVAVCSIDNLPNALEQESALDTIRDEIKDIAFDLQGMVGEDEESLMVVELNDVLNIINKYSNKIKRKGVKNAL